MILLVYSVKDIVSGQFSDLKIFVNEDCALRWYDGLLQESKIAKDLQLFAIGSFNVSTGEFVSSLEFVKGGLINE